jgi:hypothetical protein
LSSNFFSAVFAVSAVGFFSGVELTITKPKLSGGRRELVSNFLKPADIDAGQVWPPGAGDVGITGVRGRFIGGSTNSRCAPLAV